MHKAAKLAIKQGFEKAVEDGRPYKLRWRCPECGHVQIRFITQIVTRVEIEANLGNGVRADLLFTNPTKRKFSFTTEIIVAHNPDPATKERYATMGIPVFLVYPTWENIASYTQVVRASDTINVTATRCSTCRERREEINRELSTSTPPQRTSVTLWECDSNGRQMYSRTRETVHRYARKLVRLGFRQSAQKPHLFYLKAPLGIGTVYANLGGTDVIPIWGDTSAFIHWRLTGEKWEKRAVIRAVRKLCEEHGVPTRISSSEQAEPEGLFFGEADEDEI